MENAGTKNFTVDELKCKCCGIFGMKPAFLEKLQEYRDLWARPMVINSAYRCANHNKAVGGHANSEHMQGIAVDVQCAPQDRFKMVEIAVALGFKGIGIYPDRVHIDYRLGRGSMWIEFK